MKEVKRDILAESPELKKMPYSVPEGYFEGFKAQMKPEQKKHISLAPYISIAASIVILISVGLYFLKGTPSAEEMTKEDFLVFSNQTLSTEYYESGDQLAEASIEDEDIIQYLIYSGISAEELELSK